MPLRPPLAGVALLRGFGAPTAQSALLTSVSWPPQPRRWTASAFDVAGALLATVPIVCGSRPVAVVPMPTKSWIEAVVGSAPLSTVVVFVSATLNEATSVDVVPLPRLKVGKLASAVGSAGASDVVCVENAIRKYLPAPTVGVPGIACVVQVVPDATATCTAQFVIVTG